MPSSTPAMAGSSAILKADFPTYDEAPTSDDALLTKEIIAAVQEAGRTGAFRTGA